MKRKLVTGTGLMMLLLGGSGIDSAPVMCGAMAVIGSLLIYMASREEQYE